MLLNRRYWNQPLYLTPEATVELQFWLEEIGQINGQEIWHSPSAVHVVYSDASDKGYIFGDENFLIYGNNIPSCACHLHHAPLQDS